MTEGAPAGGATVESHLHVGGRYGVLADYHWVFDRVARAVIVQPVQDPDDELLLTALDDDRVVGGVMTVDHRDPRAADRVVDLADAHPGIRGVRLVGGRGFAAPSDQRLLPALADRALMVSVLAAAPHDAAELGALCRRLPDCVVRAEHFGGIAFTDDGSSSAIAALAALARSTPNLATTCSGFFVSSAPYPYAAAPGAIGVLLAAFGPDRISWSGDPNRPEGPQAYARDLSWFRDDAGIPPAAVRTILANDFFRR
jgi:predicted TIM-barrel fold metal-dependent hydrolase